MAQAQSRLDAIREQIAVLNLEAEKLLLDNPELQGTGSCGRLACACQGYVHSNDTPPAVCGRSRCGHYASDHN
ncbi:MAG: hypothetical protein AAF610_08545 [Pseudomonadota bacterium]